MISATEMNFTVFLDFVAGIIVVEYLGYFTGVFSSDRAIAISFVTRNLAIITRSFIDLLVSLCFKIPKIHSKLCSN